MKRILAVLIGVAALLLPPVSGATAATTGPFQIVNYNSGSCAGLQGTSLSDNAVFTEYPCGSTGFNDQWNFIENFQSSTGYWWYQMQNAYSGKCAQPVGRSTTVGADIVQVTCTAPASSSSTCSSSCSAQLWRIETTSPYSGYGYNYYYNRYSNQCLNTKDGLTTNGTHITQTNCGSSHLSDMWCINGSLYCKPGVTRPYGG